MLRCASRSLGRGLVCVLLLAAVTLGAGCTHQVGRVSVSERSSGALNGKGYYQVRSGDTLSEIALRYGMDYRVLARYNGIPYPYTIRVGQKLWLHDRGYSKSRRSTRSAKSSTASASRSKARSAPATASRESWIWPTSGRVVEGYRTSGKVNKGINIGGEIGQTVNAARSGEVVYAGDGLKSYGLLVIIKHDGQYISAYAYNRRTYVEEGDKVKKGQKIAQMGARQGASAQLHFEIRRDGQPVNPLNLLPAR